MVFEINDRSLSKRLVVSRLLLVPFSIIMVIILLFVTCGKTVEPVVDPYEQLSGERWVHRYTVTEGDQKIKITLTFNFGISKLYTRSKIGLISGEPAPDYSSTESGSYEIVDNTIIFTPESGSAYVVEWRILPGSGNLELKFNDGSVIEYDIDRDGNN